MVLHWSIDEASLINFVWDRNQVKWSRRKRKRRIIAQIHLNQCLYYNDFLLFREKIPRIQNWSFMTATTLSFTTVAMVSLAEKDRQCPCQNLPLNGVPWSPEWFSKKSPLLKWHFMQRNESRKMTIFFIFTLYSLVCFFKNMTRYQIPHPRVKSDV